MTLRAGFRKWASKRLFCVQSSTRVPELLQESQYPDEYFALQLATPAFYVLYIDIIHFRQNWESSITAVRNDTSLIKG